MLIGRSLSGLGHQSRRRLAAFRATVGGPSAARPSSEAEFYTVPEAVVEALQLSRPGYLSEELRKAHHTFGQLDLLVRRPFLDLKACLESLRPQDPASRFIVHGAPGQGKSTCLWQMAHWAIEQGWALLYWPDCLRIVRPRDGIAMSKRVSGRIDTPAASAQWLQDFLAHNSHCLESLAEVRLSRAYEWSPRETSEAGAALVEVAELGAAKAKYASDAARILVKELTLAASQQKIRLLVLADCVNALFKASDVKREDGSFAASKDLTLALAVRDAIARGWSGGAVVASTDDRERVTRQDPPFPTLPLSLLNAEAFDHLHPFLPVHVPLYTWPEADAILDQAIGYNFLQLEKCRAGPGRRQLVHLAGFNPLTLTQIINPL